jgi:hypothetical protein
LDSKSGWLAHLQASSRIRWGVTKAPGFAAKLFQQHAILFLEIVDDVLLVPVHPAGRSDEEEL